MIAFDFEYYRPSTAEEAVLRFQQADAAGLNPLYYGGGTEIISMARLNQLRTGAVIDIKAVPDCNVYGYRGERLCIGAAIPLTTLTETMLFPLLGETVSHVADHTNCNKITVGGNLCGRFYYREAVLPFLLADSQVVLAGPRGLRTVSVHELFNGPLRLPRGELLVQIVTDKHCIGLPYVTVKKTKQEYIDYPIVRIGAMRTPDGIRAAFSGSEAPFRSLPIEQALNRTEVPLEQRVEQAINLWPMPILDDILASAAYRVFVLRNALTDVMEELERRGKL